MITYASRNNSRHQFYLSVFRVLKSTRRTPFGICSDFITSAVDKRFTVSSVYEYISAAATATYIKHKAYS